jgi:hypothetical protein
MTFCCRLISLSFVSACIILVSAACVIIPFACPEQYVKASSVTPKKYLLNQIYGVIREKHIPTIS